MKEYHQNMVLWAVVVMGLFAVALCATGCTKEIRDFDRAHPVGCEAIEGSCGKVPK